MYIWAIRHPASGYVQGINDLVTPFFVVFLSAYVGMSILKKHEIPYCFVNGLSHKCHSAHTGISNQFTCDHLSKIPKLLQFSVKYSIWKFASLNGLEINITVHYVVLIYFMYFLDGDLENHDVSQLPKETLDVIEADSFWCMSKLLDGIQVCNAT